ncbi:MAG TPA: glycosyltransferase family 4 protein [Thermoanaerobaculia bacterium]|nr:glycosyltransferase family 4 protein [Thermoanaerobaculia bacterium]
MNRLLYVVPDARFFVTHRMDLAVAAGRAGYEVHVATPDGDEVPNIVAAGLAWHRVRFGPLRKKPWSDLESVIDLIRLARALRPALMHNVTFKAVLYGTIAARMAGTRGVVNALTGLGEVFDRATLADRFWSRLILLLMRFFVRHERMRMIVQNAEDLELLIEERALRREDGRLIRGSGVSTDHFRPAERPASDVPVIAFVGRLLTTKGVRELVEASRLLRKEGVRARFVLAGEIDESGGLAISRDDLAAWEREGLVEYLGYFRDPRPVYAMADIVALPSYREGMPKSLLEAASCALPLVTSDTPGCRDVVRDGVNGFVVPVRDAKALAGALATLVRDAALRGEMGRRGRERILAELSIEKVIGATLDVYAELLR